MARITHKSKNWIIGGVMFLLALCIGFIGHCAYVKATPQDAFKNDTQIEDTVTDGTVEDGTTEETPDVDVDAQTLSCVIRAK